MHDNVYLDNAEVINQHSGFIAVLNFEQTRREKQLWQGHLCSAYELHLSGKQGEKGGKKERGWLYYSLYSAKILSLTLLS